MNASSPLLVPSDQTSWVRMIDHTLLKSEATAQAVKALIEEAWNWGFWSVCLYPGWLSYARRLLTECWENAGDSHRPLYQDPGNLHLPHLCAVVGFPSGAQTTRIKVSETVDAIREGAQEIDWVLPIGYYLSGEKALLAKIKQEIQEVTEAARFEGALSKVILETSFLNPDQIRELSRWCVEMGADFIKTSTGFGSRGASLDDIKIMAETVQGTPTKVKASGGIRDFKTARGLVELGAHRIGSSASVKIIQEMLAAAKKTGVDDNKDRIGGP